MKQVYFIGAGPGDPELLTIKGKRIIEEAEVIIYAGSLVNPEILKYNRKEALCFNSAGLTLEEVLEIMKDSVKNGKLLVRLHTGDPSLYGAIREQMDELDRLTISYDVIPGVSSFQASAAALKSEFTLPGVSQSVICTRVEGRTPVPQKESLELLASHQSSMCIFLSVQMIETVVEKLLSHYPALTPAAVVEKASWNDERIIRGTLCDIAQKVKEAGIRKTAMILVGKFLDTGYEKSRLYDKSFSHEYRKAK